MTRLRPLPPALLRGTGRRLELATYQRVRRYAVPRWMIDAATGRRLAGDSPGALAAAKVDIDVDLRQVAARRGADLAGRIGDDLRHLAPDLLRWHINRVAVAPGDTWAYPYGVLAEYDGTSKAILMVCRARRPSWLKVWVRSGPGRETGLYRIPRACWDARRTGDLVRLCGGAGRIPFFDAAGRRLDDEELPDGPRPGDPAAHTEWVTMLLDHGRVAEALEACGIAAAARAPLDWPSWPLVAVERLAAAARRVAGTGAVWLCGSSWPLPSEEDLRLRLSPSGAVTVAAGGDGRDRDGRRTLQRSEYRHPVDFDLLRFGFVRPDELHPLVGAALFPAREPRPGDGPPPPSTPEPVRIRCQGTRHMVSHAGGRLTVPHDPEEIAREEVLAKLGGRLSGCLLARHNWHTGGPALAKDLARQREELTDRAFHGDTPGVTALLDAGFDPAVRDARGRTLLHLLSRLTDHETLLPRLLAAGLDVNAVDGDGYTPLHVAVDDLADDLAMRLRGAGGTDACWRKGIRCRAAEQPR